MQGSNRDQGKIPGISRHPTTLSELPESRLYLGIEHRVESIHIDVFTHQLQEETTEAMRGAKRGEGLWPQWPSPGTAAESTGCAEDRRGCCSEWGSEDWVPGSEVLQSIKGHKGQVLGTGTRSGASGRWG